MGRNQVPAWAGIRKPSYGDDERNHGVVFGIEEGGQNPEPYSQVALRSYNPRSIADQTSHSIAPSPNYSRRLGGSGRFRRASRSICILNRRKTDDGLFNSCSQILNTTHPRRLNALETSLSRCLFDDNLLRQNALFVLGWVECLGQPCQKHPSMNTARRRAGKTKSGRTLLFRLRAAASELRPDDGSKLIAMWRRQPVIRYVFSSATNASSVSRFPRPLIRDMTSDRLALLKTSTI